MAPKSKAFGTVAHLAASAPGKVVKMPGAARGPERPSGGMGRAPLPGVGAKSVTMSRTKEFSSTRASATGSAHFTKGPTNTTGRALSTAMIGPGGQDAHVARVGREVDKGAGMAPSKEFVKGSVRDSTG